MSSTPPTGASNVPVPLLWIKHALFKSSGTLDKGHLAVDRQQQSLLVDRLPPEIRRIIWQFALGGKRIYFRQRLVRGTWVARYTYKYQSSPVSQARNGRCAFEWRPDLRHVTGLLKTCRLFLQEGIDELYGSNCFIFKPRTFWGVSMKIMPHHFARLRIMDFHMGFDRDDRVTWTQLCKAIAGMVNLGDLYMRLSHTSTSYDDDCEKYQGGGLRCLYQKVFRNPKLSFPVSEDFILDSLYQIQQVKKFVVRLDDRWGDVEMPKVQPNAPFKLICKLGKDMVAKRDKKEQEEHERKLMEQQKAAEEHRLSKAQREAERLRFEMERKAQEIVESYQSFSG